MSLLGYKFSIGRLIVSLLPLHIRVFKMPLSVDIFNGVHLILSLLP